MGAEGGDNDGKNKNSNRGDNSQMLDTQNLMEGRYGRESAQMEDKSKQRKERKDGKTDDNFQSASRKSSAVKVEENKKEWPTTPLVMESQQWKSLVKHKTQIQVKILKKKKAPGTDGIDPISQLDEESSR